MRSIIATLIFFASALSRVGAKDSAPKEVDLSKLPPAASVKVDFARDIQPLLADRCVKCHGPEKQKGGLRLDAKGLAMQGGDDGKIIESGKSAESRLIHLVAGLEADTVMPPKDKGERLTGAQIGLLRAWIDQGVSWPGDGKVARMRSEHWSLQPLKKSVPPVVVGPATEVDAFILAKLSAKGLALSPEADPRTLIRRLSYDLTGLPPTPEEVEAIVES
jgi:mono/diheme cytochrome c family protein